MFSRLFVSLAVVPLILVTASAGRPATVRVEHSKSLPPPGNSLGSKFYTPTKIEQQQTKAWKPAERNSGSAASAKLAGASGRRVSCCGIVREVKEDKQKSETSLLVEMKYFDGLMDTHQMIVSIKGGGDFRVTIPGTGHKIKRLSLVRVYGKVTAAAGKPPTVTADYVRCWDWGQFAFMAYGTDKSNPKWVKLRKVSADEIYSSRPTNRYYEQRLGKR
jgi:hypothetical protein